MQCRACRYLLDVCEVEMATVNLQFDHAIQKHYQLNSQPNPEQTTIFSGDAIFGYNTNNTYSDYYHLDLYYRITDDILAYKFSDRTQVHWSSLDGYTFWPSGEISHSGDYSLAYSFVATEKDVNRYIYYDNSTNSRYEVTTLFNGSCVLHHNYNDNNVGIHKLENAEYLVIGLRPARNFVFSELAKNGYVKGIFHNIEDTYVTINTEDIPLVADNIYPINVNCRNDRVINVTWDLINPRDYIYEGQPIYYPAETTVEVTQGQTVKTYTSTESYVSCPIPANELVPGEATYKVTLTSNYGRSYEGVEQTFTVIGQTSAPEITNITQDSFPTITWICADQAAWELIIRDNNSVVYHSDMKAGTEQSFTLPVMLEDGSYSVEMRALNIYGYYTDWGSYGLTLSPTKPTAATNLIVSTNANYTVTIDCTAPEDAGTLYVVRRRTPNDKAEIIGEYNNGFTDYYVPINTTYEYAVRNYVTGYADTDFIDATIKCPGVVIRDGEDLSRFIPLWKNDNEEFDVIANDSRSDTLVQCLGRKYPVNEVGEWITSTRTFTAHISASDINKLNDINLNSKCVYLQNKDECIPCKMEINDAGEYNGGGRIINFTLTRIDEEMA